jgi:hypothetical protein
MKSYLACVCLAFVAMAGPGCSADVKTTPDSTKVEVEVPKVEVNKTPDLNPATDDDVDVKVPKSE